MKRNEIAMNDMVDGIKGIVLFDFDGTLSFTERLNMRAVREVADEHASGDAITASWWYEHGCSHTLDDIIENAMHDCSITDINHDTFEDEYVEKSRALYNEKGLELYSYVVPSLTRMAENGCRFGIWSNNLKSHIEHWLDIWGIARFFDDSLFFTFQNSGVGKRDMLREFMRGNGKTNVTVFDDGYPYLDAAHSLGCTTVGVRHSFSRLRGIEACVDMLVDVRRESSID